MENNPMLTSKTALKEFNERNYKWIKRSRKVQLKPEPKKNLKIKNRR